MLYMEVANRMGIALYHELRVVLRIARSDGVFIYINGLELVLDEPLDGQISNGSLVHIGRPQ